MEEAEEKQNSWALAQQTRDRVVQLLEDLEGDKKELRAAIKKWRINVGLAPQPGKPNKSPEAPILPSGM
jgi:hypothetical protein